MRTLYNPNQSPRVIIIQKLYGNYYNNDKDLSFGKQSSKFPPIGAIKEQENFKRIASLIILTSKN